MIEYLTKFKEYIGNYFERKEKDFNKQLPLSEIVKNQDLIEDAKRQALMEARKQ